MATIEKRNNSYRFIVSCGYDMTGRVYAHAIQSADDTAAEKIEDFFSKQKTKAAV